MKTGARPEQHNWLGKAYEMNSYQGRDNIQRKKLKVTHRKLLHISLNLCRQHFQHFL
jgi:hypothetical protein